MDMAWTVELVELVELERLETSTLVSVFLEFAVISRESYILD